MKAQSWVAAAGLSVDNAALARCEIKGLAYDSRQVQPGFCFVAIPGRRHDGQAFVAEAVKRGAALIIGEEDGVTSRVPYLAVPDARLALAYLAAAFYQNPSADLTVLGVTGTNGKTTTTFMLQAMARALDKRTGLIGTVRYEIGDRVIPAGRTTPEAPDIQRLLREIKRAGADHAVLEVSSHALDQQRVKGVAFDVAIFTNLTRDHLDYHGDMEAYFTAKRRFFTDYGDSGKPTAAVINVDDPYGQRLIEEWRQTDDHASGWTYGLAPAADVRAADISCTATGSQCVVTTPWGEVPLRLNQMGRYNVYNALAALTAGGALGWPLAPMAHALEQMPPVPGRLEPVAAGQPFQVFVDYAHTDDALHNVCTMLAEITPGRLWLVFGCGGDRDHGKRTPMGAVAARLAHHTFITADNPRSEAPQAIADEIIAGFEAATNYTVELDRTRAIHAAIDAAAPGDTVLIAGKGHEKYQEFAHTVVPFDDVDVARAALTPSDAS